MIIHYLKEDCLIALKKNIRNNIKNYNLPTNEWIYEFFDGESPFLEYKYKVEDFQFDSTATENGEIGKQEVENIKKIYTSMKNLTDTQATDERLWAGLTHGDFYTFMNKRWGKDTEISNIKKSEMAIKSRYFFGGGSGKKRSLIINTLARLWWIGRLTYDSKRKNPFELTSFFEDDFATKSLILFSSNYMSNSNVARGLLSALLKLEKDYKELNLKKRDIYYKSSQYLNVFGGTHILDYYSEEEIKDRVINYIYGLVNKKPPIIVKPVEIATKSIKVIQQPKIDETINSNDINEKEASVVNNVEEETELFSNDILFHLQKLGLLYVDNREKSSIIWVYYNKEKKELFEKLIKKLGLKYTLEKRGALATNNKPAWCVMFANRK